MSETPETDRKRRIFVIDDHPSTRLGLTVIINMAPDLEVCGDQAQAIGAAEEIERLQPDAMLLDMRLKDYSGLEFIRDLRAAGSRLPILVISSADENFYARRVLNAKGNGYLMKEEATDQIIDGLRTVLRGEVYLSERMVRQHVDQLNGSGTPVPGDVAVDQLTDREFEIFELLGEGRSAEAIGIHLKIRPKTVYAHQSNMSEKLGLTSTRELVRQAMKWHEATRAS